ncbi:NAD(P)-binding protein [Aspergillus undulatus]|uniref:NAD(P)-binding protein n=1 Tax=Aspergillus undulatus TaxID=1810928 RepID=UPI003CCD8545
MGERQVIALAGGTGDLGRYIHEELTKGGWYSVVLLTRKEGPPSTYPNTTTHQTDYTEASLLNILNATRATALISTIRCDNSAYLPVHRSLLAACLRSETCKRFIPSEWAGNIEGFPDMPRSYGATRAPFRKELEQAPAELKWTLFNLGWFMDYFVAPEKSYMKNIPGEFPIDLEKWEYIVRGSGDEPQSWTCGRDVARAVVELLKAEDWEPVTYVAGGWGTFNEAAALLERFYRRKFTRTYRSLADIHAAIQEYESNPANDEEAGLLEVEQWQVEGATAVPERKTLWQRQEYFSNVRFLSLEGLLEAAEGEGCI